MISLGKFDEAALRAAEQQVRLVMMASGGVTLEQVNKYAPGMARAVVGAYLTELRLQGGDQP